MNNHLLLYSGECVGHIIKITEGVAHYLDHKTLLLTEREKSQCDVLPNINYDTNFRFISESEVIPLQFTSIDVNCLTAWHRYMKQLDIQSQYLRKEFRAPGMFSGNRYLKESPESDVVIAYLAKIHEMALPLKSKVRIGDSLTVIEFGFLPAAHQLQIFGSTEPKIIKNIIVNSHNKITKIIFKDDTSYPRLPEATIYGKPGGSHFLFRNKHAAEKAVTFALLSVPDGWECECTVDSPATDFYS